ncbi:hypothetical protein M885DRAFT_506131 [Pelagophyceae sp. CCMP2097]|nr:hypothetical protein M885DRAFT_506131 [Pelagophyceae sp. CCMP2097]|mmetsp:Transcript_27168/g.97056  ORF Transcript_27168/g.97056 Transcript_27168/m.97056 type:complete len:588 (+) Transcript_27168:846-2609(+)
MLDETTTWDARLRAVLPPPSVFDKSTFIKGCVAWTMADAKYGEAMLHDVVDMAAKTAGFGGRFFVVALDRDTLRAAAAGGLRAVGAPGLIHAPGTRGDSSKERLKAIVQQSKYFVSYWLVSHDFDFFFFEMDVWFVSPAQHIIDAMRRSGIVRASQKRADLSEWPHKSERGVVGSMQLICAASADNPTASNIGVFAAVASNATREFFAAWLQEAKTRPEAHDQLLFHNLIYYARMTARGHAAPSDWNGKPRMSPPSQPVFAAFIPVHVGACSILPVPTERTVFVHTLGTIPLQSQHGKQVHAKELAVWHGLGSPTVQGKRLPTYYGAGAHEGTKYVALDGPVSICEQNGWHDEKQIGVKMAILILVSALTDRVLILPKVLFDFHAYFPWTFIDLSTMVPLVKGWRETNFMSTRRAWHNATAPFRSVASLNLEANAVGVYRQDEQGNETAQWYRLRRPARPPLNVDPSGWQSVQLDELVSAVSRAGNEELLLIKPSFVNQAFVKQLTYCASDRNLKPQCRQQGLPSALAAIYHRLKWCGKEINSKKYTSESFQNSDCFARGDDAGPHQSALTEIALKSLGNNSIRRSN